MSNEIDNIKESLTYLAERIEELEEEEEQEQSHLDQDIEKLKKYEALRILKHSCGVSESNFSVDNDDRLNAIKQRGFFEILQFLRDEGYINGNLDAENPSNSIQQTEGESA